MIERVQVWLRWARAHPVAVGYVGVAFALSVAQNFDIKARLVLWFACAPLSVVSGPYELLAVSITGDLLGDTVARIADVLWWVMLAGLQALAVWGIRALLLQARAKCRSTVQP
ncbi:hypothetical protein [Actinoplanes sp. NPDC048796]|uniref:hypothetical protein n=1 Tax=Actinoplanes sp. NPDC048796 TaxID=3155640 RepID=UPI0033DAA938